MKFTEAEISLAKQLHNTGVSWLPLWRKCREILQEHGVRIKLFDDVDGKIQIYSTDKFGNTSRFKPVIGDTDLEAIYKVLLEVLTNCHNPTP